MPARKSVPAGDHTGMSLFGHSEVTETPDGAPGREYSNKGNGLSAVSGKNYAESHGMKPNAPTSGGDAKAAYDALLTPGKAV